MEAWRIYVEEFRARGRRAAAQQFDRSNPLAEAAHEAYRVTSNRLTGEHGWQDERALVILRGFNAAARQWIEEGTGDWSRLERELERIEGPVG